MSFISLSPGHILPLKLLELSKKEEVFESVLNASQAITEGQLNEKKLEAESLAGFPPPCIADLPKNQSLESITRAKK